MHAKQFGSQFSVSTLFSTEIMLYTETAIPQFQQVLFPQRKVPTFTVTEDFDSLCQNIIQIRLLFFKSGKRKVFDVKGNINFMNRIKLIYFVSKFLIRANQVNSSAIKAEFLVHFSS